MSKLKRCQFCGGKPKLKGDMNVCGYYDIEVDEEFLNYLSAYFESKKDELEKEFEKLG